MEPVSYWLVPVGFVEVDRGSLVVELPYPVLEVGFVVEKGSLVVELPCPVVEVGFVEEERESFPPVRLLAKWLPILHVNRWYREC